MPCGTNRVVYRPDLDSLYVMATLADMGEHNVIRRLAAMLGSHPDLVVGAGDDCAVVCLPDSGFDQVFTTDPVIERVHFLPSDNPERIGNKAAGRVLSDIAAMGGNPQWLLVNVVAPPTLDFCVLEGIYTGMTALCRRFGATIIGGDLAQGECLEIHVFGTGVLPSGSALLRSGARVGDAIYVTGTLGGSIHGKHLDFVPRVEEGIWLRESGAVGAMMDISDGLATDLRHILESSNVGAELEAGQLPVRDSLDGALYDGEDFELLFTVLEEREADLLELWNARFDHPPVRIGRVTGEVGVLKIHLTDGGSRLVEGKAYEHFTARRNQGR